MLPPDQDAAKALQAKAERILRRLDDQDPKAGSKRQRAEALLTLASSIAAREESEIAAVSSGREPDGTDRKAAAKEIHALALRRESSGTSSDLAAKIRPGWVAGGDDFAMPIQPELVRQAVELCEIALSLHDDSFWRYSQGLLQERLGDYAGAVVTFERVRGSYAKHTLPHIQRCRQKISGSYDADAALDAAFDSAIDTVEKSAAGSEKGLRDVLGAMGEFLGGILNSPALQIDAGDTDSDAADRPDLQDSDALDQAATVAQAFAELLVDGDYRGAHGLLASNLRGMDPDNLRAEFEQMVAISFDESGDASEFADDLLVTVVGCEQDMPGMTGADLGWVYVGICGDEVSEAITVVVTAEGDDLRIRELEWGRP